ncbi:MAG: glutamyl-tRNA reductase, partial [Bacteroidota bacterium]
MIEDFQILSLSHKALPVNVLGKFQVQAVNLQEEQEKLSELKEAFGIEELIYVSTCNRVMFIFYNAVAVNQRHLIPFFRQINPALASEDLELLKKAAIFYNGIEAVEHLHRVASSLESMVIGEKEILRQIRLSFEKCMDWNLSGDHLRVLMRSTIETAKEVFSNTRIGDKQVSVVSLAINSFLKYNPNPDSKILMIGAGETNTLVSKYLDKKGFTNVSIFNRSISNGSEIAALFDTEVQSLDALKDFKDSFDTIFICTNASEPILTADLYAKMLNN